MKPTILTAHENEDQNHTLALWLIQGGFGVLPAHSGAEALALASEKQPSLILLHAQFADVDGYEACSRLKAEPQTSRIPVVLHTENGGGAQAAKDAGADAFLTYPIEPAQLWMVVRGCIARAAGAKAAAA